MKKILTFIIITFPTLVSAQQLRDINDVAKKSVNIGNLIVELAIALAVLFIIVNVVRYLIAGSDDEEARKKGGDAILYGVIGLFAILSIWGMVALLTNTFRLKKKKKPDFSNIKIGDPTNPNSQYKTDANGTPQIPGVNADY